jgi:arginase family enzyme
MDWAERLVDLGDVEVNRFDPHSSFEPVRQIVQEAAEVGAIPLCIGGDHSLTYAALTAVAKVHDGLRLIQIDAHHDATNPAQWNCRYNHGTFVRNLIEDGVLAGPDVLQLAVRDFQWTDSGAHFLAEHEAYCRAMSQIDDHGLDDMLTMIRAEADRPTYITFDIDSVDPAYAPGTGEHMPGGLSAREAAALVRSLFDGSIRIVGADLVEVAPGLDPTGRTVALAANLLGLMADGLAGPEKSAIHSRKVETARGRAT